MKMIYFRFILRLDQTDQVNVKGAGWRIPVRQRLRILGIILQVLLRLLWIKCQPPAEKEDGGSKVFKFSVSSTDCFDLLNFPIHSFCFGIGLWMTKRVTNSVKMILKHLGNLHDFVHAGLFHTGDPVVKIRSGFGIRLAIKNRLEVFSESPGNADFQIRFLNHLEDLLLGFGPILLILQQRIATAFQLFGVCVHFPPPNFVDGFVEILN